MNEPLPLISVVIPTYQRNDLLGKCLDCLAPGVQTLSAELYEVIVTDDGKTTTAESMIREAYPWAKWTEGPHRGPAANRNHGAKLAKNDWLVFTDDDCLPSPGWLRAFYDAGRGGYEVLEGKTTCVDGLPSMMFESPINEQGGYLWSCNIAIKSNLFDSIGGFDEEFPVAAMEDVDLRERIRSRRLNFPFVTEAIVDHPARPIASAQSKASHSEAYIYFASKHQKAVPTRKQYVVEHLKSILRRLYRSKNRRAALAYVFHQLNVLRLSARYYI